MIRFIALCLFACSFLLKQISPVSAQADIPEVIVFVRAGCQHCKDEEAFLRDLSKQRSDIQITYLRLENPDDKKQWEQFTLKHEVSKVTPLTLIGNRLIIGFDQPETTGQQIVSSIDEAKKNGIATDIAAGPFDLNAQRPAACPENGGTPCVVEERPPLAISLPVIGTINARSYPLGGLSALLGFIDGFNPCAMWVLVTFLIILLQVGNRKRMFLFAGTFIQSYLIEK